MAQNFSVSIYLNSASISKHDGRDSLCITIHWFWLLCHWVNMVKLLCNSIKSTVLTSFYVNLKHIHHNKDMPCNCWVSFFSSRFIFSLLNERHCLPVFQLIWRDSSQYFSGAGSFAQHSPSPSAPCKAIQQWKLHHSSVSNTILIPATKQLQNRTEKQPKSHLQRELQVGGLCNRKSSVTRSVLHSSPCWPSERWNDVGFQNKVCFGH